MTKEKFKTLMASLCGYYGKTLDAMAMHTYQLEAEKVKDEDAREFYRKILQSCKFFPAMTEFREIAGMFTPQSVPLRNIELCWYCMDRGEIDYIKRTPGGFAESATYSSRCPMCNRGQYYAGWPSYLDVMGQEALEEEKRRNLERYGNITVPQAEAARIAAQNFMRGFGQ